MEPSQKSIAEIKAAVCKVSDVTMEELCGKYGGKHIQRARHVAMYIAKRNKFTNRQIADAFNVSRGTVVRGIIGICDAIEFSKKIEACVERIGVII